MRTYCGAAIWIVATTLLTCASTLNAEYQQADPFAWSRLNLRKATSFARLTHRERHEAYSHNESSVLHYCKVSVPSDPYLHRQLCTAGVSTYASSVLHESAVSGHSKPAKHKALWPLSSRDIWAFALAAVAIFIAAGGGIGGGGILVPLFASILGFAAKYAVALSNFTIVGGAFANLLFNIGRRHSFMRKPLIDWDLILVMEPSTILGAVIGGYLNKTSPGWLASVLLAILITAITWKLGTRAVITWRHESEALAKEMVPTADIEQPLLSNGDRHEQGEVHQNRERGSEPEPGRAIAPVRIPTARQSLDAHHVHAHSPMAYSAVGSLTHARNARARAETAFVGDESQTAALQAGVHAVSSGLSEQSQQALHATAHHRLAAHLAGSPEDTEDCELPQSSRQPDSPPTTLHRLSQGEGFLAPSEGKTCYPSQTSQSGGTVPQAAYGSQHRPSTPQEKYLQQLQAKESKQVPPAKLSVLLLLFAGVLASDLGKDYVRCNSLAYWGIVLSAVPLTLVITLAVRAHLVRKYHKQIDAGYEWQEGDIAWNERNSLVYPAVSSLAGLVAGMFGVGGGIVKGPLMLEMGVLPDVAAATSATMILFTSASASLVYLSFGGIAVDYSLALLALGFVVTLVGQGSTYWLMGKLQRRSVVIIAMASLMLLATVTMYYESTVTFLDALHEHTLSERGHICTQQS